MDEDIKLPEPVAWIAEYGGDIYTADQLRAAVEADRERRMKSVADLVLPPPSAYLHESCDECMEARRRDRYIKGPRNDGMKAFASACSIPLYTEEQVRLLVEPEFHARIAALRQVQALQWAAESAPEQAATAPLLARIAELEAELEKTKAIFAASCNHAAAMEMDRDAKRWRAMRQTMIAVDFEPEMGGSPVVMFELHAKAVRAGPEGADEIADAAMKEQGYA